MTVTYRKILDKSNYYHLSIPMINNARFGLVGREELYTSEDTISVSTNTWCGILEINKAFHFRFEFSYNLGTVQQQT
jgi:hypothetical protein